MECKRLQSEGQTRPQVCNEVKGLVIVFKYCSLKRCENCSLKSVIEIHIFSVYKTKKCVWYHSLNYMFQCLKI